MRRKSGEISTVAALGFQGGIAIVGAITVWLLGIKDWVGDIGWLTATALGVAGSVLTFLVLGALTRVPGPVRRSLSIHMHQLRIFARDYPWWVLAVLSLLAGVGEELLFRGGVQGYLSLHLGDGLAIALAAIAFGLVHYLSFVYFLLATGLGLMFGLAYWVSDSLLLVMVWHGVYDMIALYSLRRHPQQFGIH